LTIGITRNDTPQIITATYPAIGGKIKCMEMISRSQIALAIRTVLNASVEKKCFHVGHVAAK